MFASITKRVSLRSSAATAKMIKMKMVMISRITSAWCGGMKNANSAALLRRNASSLVTMSSSLSSSPAATFSPRTVPVSSTQQLFSEHDECRDSWNLTNISRNKIRRCFSHYPSTASILSQQGAAGTLRFHSTAAVAEEDDDDDGNTTTSSKNKKARRRIHQDKDPLILVRSWCLICCAVSVVVLNEYRLS